MQYSDVDADGISIAANALTLNGGMIQDSGGNNAALALGSHAVSDASGHKVEGRIQLGFGEPSHGDTHGVNEWIDVFVNFGDDLSFSPSTPGGTGSLQLEVTIGSSARQINVPLVGSGTIQQVHFDYEVQPADIDTDGPSIAAGALTVTGGTLTDSGGNPAHLNFGTHAIANDTSQKVNGGVDNPPILASSGYGLPAGGTFIADERFEIYFYFSEAVAVTGAPELALTVGASTRQAVYAGCGGAVVEGFCPRSGALRFHYVVRAGDADADGIVIPINALALNGGTIRDRGGNDADLVASFQSPDPLFVNVDGSVDNAPEPSSLAISSPQSGATFGATETIAVTVTYNEPVTVSGAPQLALSIGSSTRQAGYQGCSGAWGDPAGTCRWLTFGYTVQSTDADTNGISIAATALTLNGGTIRDLGGNNAVLGLGTSAVSDSTGHKVDGSVDRAPAVIGVTITSSPRRGDTYSSWGPDRIYATVSFNEAVTVTGAPQLALAIGTQTRQADYSSGSGTEALTFSYTVQYSDVDADGVSIAANALTLNGGMIQDSGGNNAALALGSHAISDASGHKVEGRIDLDFNSSPPVSTIDTYGVNDLLSVIVDFGDDLSFSPSTPGGTGSLQLGLTIGSNTRQVNEFLSGTRVFGQIIFYYEVQSSDVDTDGVSIAAGALTVTGGTLTDSGGNPARLNFGTHAITNDIRHKVNGGVDNAPEVSGFGYFPPGVYIADERIALDLYFQEPVAVTGAPALNLRVGDTPRFAIYAGCFGATVGGFCSSGAIRFQYVVRRADVDADGVSIPRNALTFPGSNGWTIRDRGGNDAELYPFPLSGVQSNLKVNGGVDNAPEPSSLAISSPQSGATFGATETIGVVLEYDEPVIVTGSPRLALGIGAQTRQANHLRCAPDVADPAGTCRRLTFGYAVQSTDSDANGISIAANALALNGGTIRDLGGNDAGLGLGTHSVSDSSGHKVDGSVDRTPAVFGASILSSPQEGETYGVGESIRAEVRFDEAVTVTGSPQLALTVGANTRQAAYGSGSGTNALTFAYTVQPTDADTDGISVAATALALNGGSIVDSGGQSAGLGLGAHALSAQSGHKVDGSVDRAPAVSGAAVTSTPAGGGAYRAGEAIEVTVTYNEPVTVAGSPQLALSVGSGARQAGYQRCSGDPGDPAGTCRRLVFRYEVQSGDAGAVSTGALALNGGSVEDSGSNAAGLVLGDHAVGAGAGHQAAGAAPPRGGGTPPPPNRAPVAVGEFGDLDLDPGRSVEVSLSGRFRDPEGGALRYSAESLDPEVARAAVSGGRLRVEGRSPGLARVVVTATDSGGLSARLSLSVAVGRVLSFAQASASAPEGGAARLRVELSRPSERAVSVGYVLESDGDPATADADAADHGGSDGTLTLAAGEAEAFIEVPINDDMDIEPAREHLRVRLLAPDSEADWALGAATASVAIEEGVCDRTPEVRDALRGSRECREPSVRELAGRGYLNLHRRGIGSLRERDLLGLAGLRVLHLHGNGLAELPAGLFAGLGALERLRLDGNRLAELQEGLFAGLGRLSSLDLHGNRLRSLPGGLLSGLASLSRLDLGGNRLAELPAGFFEGASSLSELNLSGNPGAPFTLAMELVRTDAEDFAPGPASVVARVAEGAPFALSAGLLAEGAALSADSARIGAGQVSGAPIAVSLSEGGAARLSLSGAPEVPSGLCGDVQDGRHPCFRGVRTEAGPGLLLFKRPPRVVRAVPGQAVESLGGALALDLSEFLAADGGEVLAYSAESSDPALASVSVSGGVLSIEPNGEGLEGLVTVTVTATDSDGLAVEHRFTVAVAAAARPFARGWRLGWMAGAPAPAAEAAPQGAEPQ